MLRLESHEGTKELIDALEALKPKIYEICQNLKLSISGLNTFGQRVLYGKVYFKNSLVPNSVDICSAVNH